MFVRKSPSMCISRRDIGKMTRISCGHRRGRWTQVSYWRIGWPEPLSPGSLNDHVTLSLKVRRLPSRQLNLLPQFAAGAMVNDEMICANSLRIASKKRQTDENWQFRKRGGRQAEMRIKSNAAAAVALLGSWENCPENKTIGTCETASKVRRLLQRRRTSETTTKCMFTLKRRQRPTTTVLFGRTWNSGTCASHQSNYPYISTAVHYIRDPAIWRKFAIW